MIKTNTDIVLIMEDNIYNNLIKSIKNRKPEKFIKILVDFYSKNSNVKMPNFINLKDYLRYDTNNQKDKLVRTEKNTDIIFHKKWDEIFDMEYFVRLYSSGIYQYKNKIFELKLQHYFDRDGDNAYFPYLKLVADLDKIIMIESEE